MCCKQGKPSVSDNKQQRIHNRTVCKPRSRAAPLLIYISAPTEDERRHATRVATAQPRRQLRHTLQARRTIPCSDSEEVQVSSEAIPGANAVLSPPFRSRLIRVTGSRLPALFPLRPLSRPLEIILGQDVLYSLTFSHSPACAGRLKRGVSHGHVERDQHDRRSRKIPPAPKADTRDVAKWRWWSTRRTDQSSPFLSRRNPSLRPVSSTSPVLSLTRLRALVPRRSYSCAHPTTRATPA